MGHVNKENRHETGYFPGKSVQGYTRVTHVRQTKVVWKTKQLLGKVNEFLAVAIVLRYQVFGHSLNKRTAFQLLKWYSSML